MPLYLIYNKYNPLLLSYEMFINNTHSMVIWESSNKTMNLDVLLEVSRNYDHLKTSICSSQLILIYTKIGKIKTTSLVLEV